MNILGEPKRRVFSKVNSAELVDFSGLGPIPSLSVLLYIKIMSQLKRQARIKR